MGPVLNTVRQFSLLGMVVAVTLMMATAAEARTHHAKATHPPKESRYASIVVDADSGRVISASNPDRRCYPASLTKMMTLYLLFDALDQGRLRLDGTLPVSGHAAEQAPSKLALEPGDRIRVEDAILALVTKSANDVAVVVAEALAGTESEFAQQMTAKAHALGMNATTYRNASGLPNPLQVTTPRDQSILARALVHDHASRYHYFATREFDWQGQTIPSHNRFMLGYEGADGIKTGYIDASGFNLVASAVRDGHRLIGVVFGGNTAKWRDDRMAGLMDRGFVRLASVDGESSTEVAEDDDAATPPAAAPKDKRHRLSASMAANAATPEAPPTKIPDALFKAAAQDTAEGDDDDPPWAIQVGAYHGYKPARHAAAVAARHLGGLIAKASIDVDSDQKGNHAVFRARLIGFSESQARAACKRLAQSKRECHVIQPDG